MNHRIGLSLLSIALPAGLVFAGEDSPVDPLAIEPSAKSAREVIIPPRPERRWVLGAGVMWRNIGEVQFDTGVTDLTLPTLFGHNSFTPPPGIGPAAGSANRLYNDGFVNPDTRTPTLGRSTDYGYLNPGQIQGNNLVFSAPGGERREVTPTAMTAASNWEEDRDWELSPYLKLSRLVDLSNGWRAGPVLHFAFTNVDAGRRGLGSLAGREQLDLYDVSAVDTYDATGLVLPQAPYTGAPDMAGPLLPAAPASRTFPETLRSTDVAVWNDAVNESLDLDLFGISLGGEAVYQTSNRFYGTLGAGLVLNVADWDAHRSDSLTQVVNGGPPTVISSSRASNSGTELLLGFYFTAAAGYQLTQSFALETNLRYDWTESISDSVGNSSFHVDLSGFSFGLGGNYTFW